ncbi:hypothetical protein [Nonomuraea solani]|uniref:hypothetical protein n=1 Tax=Nonomuraea solani TaxID=1144553 RepID=UPI001359D067|nr:hypothetical protein [Nonomuraea solani]
MLVNASSSQVNTAPAQTAPRANVLAAVASGWGCRVVTMVWARTDAVNIVAGDAM